ncbi:MAG: SPOR domain-containing protein [Tannerella sp.]|nr:SPOR domain-containing protein [Tannerella sp.]
MRYYLLFSLFLCIGSGLFAQSSVFDRMSVANQEPRKGTVTIRQSQAIRSLVGSQSIEDKTETDGDLVFLLMPGYRIQVFTDNNQRTAKDEAFDKESQIRSLFSDSTYVKYNAPFWRLYVGNYITYEEAFSMKCKLSEAFPAFRKEIQIKEDEIRIPMILSNVR